MRGAPASYLNRTIYREQKLPDGEGRDYQNPTITQDGKPKRLDEVHRFRNIGRSLTYAMQDVQSHLGRDGNIKAIGTIEDLLNRYNPLTRG